MLKRNNALSVVIGLILCGLSGFAQQDLNNNNTTSPFSRFGLGVLSHYGYGRTSAMGGASLGSRHEVQTNSSNPASYNAIDSLSFVFDFGLDGTISKYKSNSGTMKAKDINFRYLSLSFPINKWIGAAMGLQPYSDMGYEEIFNQEVTGVGTVYHNYTGEGSSTKSFFGLSVMPIKGLSLGANLNYIFGRLNQNTVVTYSDATLYYLSRVESTRLSDFTLSYGLQYDYELKKNQFLTLGITFENQSNLNALHSLFTYKSMSNGTTVVSTVVGGDSIPERKGIIILPSTFGVGLSYNKLNKLEINADYYYAGWSKSTFFGSTDQLLTNLSRISAGFEYTPEAYSIRSYVKRIKYRAGLHFENSYLQLADPKSTDANAAKHQIKEFGVSFGAGIPFPKSKSTANLAVELGKQGTTDYNLAKNNYMKLSVYLNLYDYWFVKRKFD
jgi:hypothetical protein